MFFISNSGEYTWSRMQIVFPYFIRVNSPVIQESPR